MQENSLQAGQCRQGNPLLESHLPLFSTSLLDDGYAEGTVHDKLSLLSRARVAEAGLRNVSFMQSDVNQISSDKPFDAAVGRLILMCLPDPLGVLRSLYPLVRPGGVFAFQEPSWASNLSLTAHLPLWHSCTSLIRETFLRSGVNPEMGLHLYRMFQEAGLTPPNMHMEMPVGNDPEWICGVLSSLRPRIEQLNLPLQRLGGLDDLPERLRAEVVASKTVATWMALVGAWSHKPME